MANLGRFFAILLALFVGSIPAYAGVIDIAVTPWVAPRNSSAAPNAAQGMLQGRSSFGTPDTPEYFEANSNITSRDIIGTPSFPSWRGTVNPGGVFGSPFAFQNGNRVNFAFRATGADGATFFSAADVRFNAFSTIPLDVLRVNSLGGFNYSDFLIGVLYGLDGVLGGGDDAFVTSGPPETPINALFGAGAGGGFFGTGCGSCTLAQQDFAIGFLARTYPDPIKFTGTYKIAGNEGSGVVSINGIPPSPVPEPATLLLFLAGLTGIGLAKAKRRIT